MTLEPLHTQQLCCKNKILKLKRFYLIIPLYPAQNLLPHDIEIAIQGEMQGYIDNKILPKCIRKNEFYLNFWRAYKLYFWKKMHNIILKY